MTEIRECVIELGRHSNWTLERERGRLQMCCISSMWMSLITISVQIGTREGLYVCVKEREKKRFGRMLVKNESFLIFELSKHSILPLEILQLQLQLMLTEKMLFSDAWSTRKHSKVITLVIRAVVVAQLVEWSLPTPWCLRFESCHRQILYLLYWKDENRQKGARNGRFFQK